MTLTLADILVHELMLLVFPVLGSRPQAWCIPKVAYMYNYCYWPSRVHVSTLVPIHTHRPYPDTSVYSRHANIVSLTLMKIPLMNTQYYVIRHAPLYYQSMLLDGILDTKITLVKKMAELKIVWCITGTTTFGSSPRPSPRPLRKVLH